MQFRVQKCDGSTEVYLHTKVMGTIAHALTESGSFDAGVADHLAEAVTTYLQRRYAGGSISTDEIHSMLEVVLGDTGYESAALCLHEHRLNRTVHRHRLEVVHHHGPLSVDDALSGSMEDMEAYTEPWNKSVIAHKLEQQFGMERGMARAVAGNVEEQVLHLGKRRVTAALVQELVVGEIQEMRQAQESLLAQPQEQQVETVPALV